ncbi:MAG: hypothetical protein WCW31_03845 [Patescibacteria group bacterium]|jgi:hypothetical protein
MKLRITRNEKIEENPFYEFVVNTSSGEKKRILKTIIKKSNEDQRKLVERYEKTPPSDNSLRYCNA